MPPPAVGTIICTTSSTSPSAIYGGTWERYGQGRVLVSASDTDEDFKAGTTGGEKAHTLTVDELPNHRHKIPASLAGDAPYGTGNFIMTDWTFQGQVNGQARWTFADMEDGHPLFGTPINLSQEYVAVYMWRRTA